jgi:hypothetical protein
MRLVLDARPRTSWAPDSGAAKPLRCRWVTDDKGHHRDDRSAGYTVAFAGTCRDANASDDAGHLFISNTAQFAAKDPPVTLPLPTRLLYASCSVLLVGACSTGDAAVKARPDESSEALIAEPAPADEIEYTIKMACTNSPRANRRRVVVEGYVTPDNSRHQRSGLNSIVIDGAALAADELRDINARFPPDAFQDRPWMVCDNDTIRFTIPYRNSGKDGTLRFVVDPDGLVDFDR